MDKFVKKELAIKFKSNEVNFEIIYDGYQKSQSFIKCVSSNIDDLDILLQN